MFKSLKIKVILTIFLVLLSVILVIIKSISNKNEVVTTGDMQELSSKSRLSTDELKKLIPAEIDTILFQYGIKTEWIREISDKPVPEKQKKEKQKKENKKQKATNIVTTPNVYWFDKEVTVPKDLSLSELNLEIGKYLRSINFNDVSYEDAKNGNQLINIFYASDSSKKILAKINFIYSDKIKRETADICIVLDNVDKFTTAQLEKILNSSEKYSIIMPDNIDKPDIQTLILESKRDYLIRADIGMPEDITPEFKTDMREKDWKSKVRSLTYEFDRASGVIMSNPKMQYKFENEIIDEFQKYPLKAYKDTILTRFSSKETDKKVIYDLFTHILKRANYGNRTQIYLVNFSEEDFWNFTNEVHNLKKRGFKFFTFGEIIKRRNKPLEVTVQQPN
jgi:hypothetical protein